MSVISEEEARNHIMEIQRSYTVEEGRVLKALTRAMCVVNKMFSRVGHFILEFIQNAEDAKAKKVKIVLQRDFVKIFNDGKPFSRDDVEAICSVGRSSKDPREYIGYLGVGFKAVFLISSSPHIYSKPYRFKFDRNYWPNPEAVPWQITPIWLEEIPEEYKEWNVGFYIPIDRDVYRQIKDELESLTPTMLLFLHSITELEINIEGMKKIFRKEEKGGGVYTLEAIEHGRREVTNWVVFRNIVEVPDYVKKDEFTREWNREIVDKREIAVAFKLDENGDLTPVTGTIKLGVFSYIPLKEEQIALPFYIHADFLAAPGREMIHRDAKWNLWMLGEIKDFIIKFVIDLFKSHDVWRYSYTSVLYSETYQSPFYGYLVSPINCEIINGNHVITLNGDFTKISEVVKVDKEVLDLLKNPDIIERITNKKVLHPKAKVPQNFVEKGLIETITLEKVVKKEYLPRLLSELKDPNKDDQTKIGIVRKIKEFWKKGGLRGEDLIKEGFLIRTKSGKWLRPQEVVLPKEYKPDIDVEKLVMNGLLEPDFVEFVDPIFIKGETPEGISEWKKFLEELKIGKEVERKLVERVGINTSIKYECDKGKRKNSDVRLLSESEKGKGYDIESKMQDGSPKYIEVKASKDMRVSRITLRKSEYSFLLNNPDNYFVYIVVNALKDPELHVVPGNVFRDAIPEEINIFERNWKQRIIDKWKPLS
jgi:hypothetical protein